MIAFTLTNAAAVVVGLLGLTLVVNGIRFALLDESVVGGALLAIAWWLL